MIQIKIKINLKKKNVQMFVMTPLIAHVFCRRINQKHYSKVDSVPTDEMTSWPNSFGLFGLLRLSQLNTFSSVHHYLYNFVAFIRNENTANLCAMFSFIITVTGRD